MDHVEQTSRTPAGRRRRRGARTAMAALVGLALLAGACSSGERSEAVDTGDTTAPDTSAQGDATFGDLASPCGPGDASGATDQGVTDTSITIGYGDDAGYQPAPGLSAEMSQAMEAMIDWCNEQGGINGREVVGNYYDAAVTEVSRAMTDACDQVFMLVGQGWVFDSGQEEIRRGCGLSSIPGYAVSPQFSNAPDMFQAAPNPVDVTSVQIAAAFQRLFPEEITKTAVVYADYPATRDTKDKVLQSYPEFGFEFLECPQIYGIAGEADWKPLAQKLQDCGAEVVYFSGSAYPNFQNFLEAADQVGYRPLWITDANNYDESFALWNVNGYADDVYLRAIYVPLFEADASAGTQAYLDVMEAAGGEANQLGQQSASAFLLWATAAQACGSDLTRACVMDQVSGVHDWTGGGMHAPGDTGENLPSDCGMVLKLDGTEFVRVDPEGVGEFDCDPSYVVPVSGPVVDQANLDADRISQLG